VADCDVLTERIPALRRQWVADFQSCPGFEPLDAGLPRSNPPSSGVAPLRGRPSTASRNAGLGAGKWLPFPLTPPSIAMGVCCRAYPGPV
jgi:hypothetical protein